GLDLELVAFALLLGARPVALGNLGVERVLRLLQRASEVTELLVDRLAQRADRGERIVGIRFLVLERRQAAAVDVAHRLKASFHRLISLTSARACSAASSVLTVDTVARVF